MQYIKMNVYVYMEKHLQQKIWCAKSLEFYFVAQFASQKFVTAKYFD